MKITYIFRAKSHARSIERVFEPIIAEMRALGYEVVVENAIKGNNISLPC